MSKISNALLQDLCKYVGVALAKESAKFSACDEEHSNIKYSERDNCGSGTRNGVRYSIRDDVSSLELYDFGSRLEPSFVSCLIEEIDKKGLRDSAVYKAAGLDRRLFSKIKSDPFYHPSKDTCIALAMALKLNLDETNRFLSKAGFTLSHSIKRDLIFEYFFKNSIYDLHLANSLLDNMGEMPLGR